MKDREILNSVKRSMEQAPIDILQNIKDAPRTKMLRHDEITKQDIKENPFKKFMPYGSIAAAFLMVFFGWQYQTKIPDSHIYIDVNPSVEITTNRLNKVIDIRADNQDGILLTEDFNYKGMTINEVAEEILDRMMNRKYLDKDHKYLLISVYNKNEGKAESQKLELDKKIHQHLEKKELHPIVLSQKLDNTSTIENYAKKYGVSVSKMTFIRNLMILNPELETENLVDLTIEELVDLSQDMNLELDKIIESTDFDKIKTPELEIDNKIGSEIVPIVPIVPIAPIAPVEKYDDDDMVQEKKVISSDEAKKIALSIANGIITDFDFDDDDLEYEIEIQVGDLEYEITINARTGQVLEVEIDD